MRLAVSLALFATCSLAAFGQTSVLTYHNDNARTGLNPYETILTPETVNSSRFGKLFTVATDGKVDAQPLFVSQLVIGGVPHNVVFAATEHDSVYAFDADTGAIYSHVSLVNPGETPSDDRGCGQVTPEIGITATPVIDLAAGPNGTIYFVSMSKDVSGNYYHRLHALDLTTGGEEFGGPVTIQATFPGTGDNSINGQVVFDPKQYNSRPGLLLLNGIVYTSWGSHCDDRPYTGWLIGYNSRTLQQTSVFNFAPNGYEAALWNSGGGPAADTQGNIFVAVANGLFDTNLNAQGFPSGGDYGNAFVKLSTGNGALTAIDYWTMDNSDSESNGDVDLGSGGIMLLPDMQDANGAVRHIAVGAGKDTNLWVLDRDNMGKYDSQANATIYQAFNGALPGGIWSNPAYFNGRVYFGSVNDVIRAFQFTQARLSGSPVSTTLNRFVYPGATPSISANGTASAILWALENTNPAVLHAYDANHLASELYNSNQAPGGRDQFGPGNKFITPTVANGKVFVGTTNSVAVFGLFNQPPVMARVPGILSQVSIGSDGAVWGINSLGEIYQYDAKLQSWIPIPGYLTQIAVGGNGNVWGIGGVGDIYRFDSSAQNWIREPGTLAQIAVGADGDVWGLTASGFIYHFNPAIQNWESIPGYLAQIAVGFDGAVWGINDGGAIYQFNPGTRAFEQIPGFLKQVSVGSDGAVWGVNAANLIYRFNPISQSFEQVPGALAQVTVGSGANVWGVNPNGFVYHFDPVTQSWINVRGNLMHVTAGASGQVWGVDSSGGIYEFVQPATPVQTFHLVPGPTLVQIAAAADGNVWGLDAKGNAYAYNAAAQTWQQLGSNFTHLAIGFGGNVWATDIHDQSFHFDVNSQSWAQVPGLLDQIAVDASGDAWGINAGGALYRYDFGIQNWDLMPGWLVQLSVGADGALWGINGFGQTYRFDTQTQNWDWIPGNLRAVAVGSTDAVWGINGGEYIYSYDQAMQSWINVPGLLVQLSTGFDGAVWGVNGLQQIYRFDAVLGSWDAIPGALTQISVGADAVVWGINSAGQVYRFQ